MKAPVLFAAAALVASSLAAPSFAHASLTPHFHYDGDVVTPNGPRPPWSHGIDPEILHPIPKPRIPWPGPVCLSCPPFQLDERVVTPQVILQ